MAMLQILLLASTIAVPAAEPDALPEATSSIEQRQAIEEGRLLFGIYCSNCHGPAGRGDGPSARSLKPRPPDLTILSRDNDGEFPLARVLLNIDGRSRVPGHSKGRMPIWGLNLQEADADTNQEGAVRDKIQRLIEYLKSIQRP
jgi:mono/diheme cytochrome c family protein